MKQIIVCVCVLFSLVVNSCAQPEDVEKRVNEMYSHVISEYLKPDFRPGDINFDSLYFSEEFYRLDSVSPGLPP